MTNKQPEALRLAGLLELAPEDGVEPQTTEDAAAELRRQHTRIAELEARIKTMAEEHSDELTVAHLDGRMRVAQPAGAQQPGDERAAFERWSKVTNQGYDLARNVSGKLQTFESTETEHAWRGFFHGLRASNGQAPVQTAPAAIQCVECNSCGSVFEIDTYMAGYTEGKGHCLNCHGIDSAPPTQPAPQHEAQEPVAWYVTGCGRLLDEYEAEAEARRIGGTAKAMPLYTVPQPSPASQGDALDAARLEQRSQPSESEGMTIAGNGASELGKLMREQRALRGGFYPDGNPNTARKQGANHD